jgi:hypothetical protein
MAGLRAGRGLTVSTSAACLCIEGLLRAPEASRLLKVGAEKRKAALDQVGEGFPRLARFPVYVVPQLDVGARAGRGNGPHESSARPHELGAWRLVGASAGRGNDPAP